MKRVISWALPVLFLGLAIAFWITGFDDTVISDGLLFAVSMQLIPILGCIGLTVMAIKKW